ncbi:hypothetical protein N6P31_02915 [Pectobacterium betavasculorum]|uniref:hypothetical protein n=1 Tax=Pectobacterium betavasculorum TaxID=55207 RepID=UPI00313C0B56
MRSPKQSRNRKRMNLRRYIFRPKVNTHTSYMGLSREFTGLNKNAYDEKANDIVKNIEWIRGAIVLFREN